MSVLRLVTGDQPDRTPSFDLLADDFLTTCGAEIIHERRKIRTVTVGAASAAPPVDRLTDPCSHGSV